MVLLNVCLCALLLPQLVMLRVALSGGEHVGHVALLLSLTLLLLGAINWFIAQIGLVSSDDQKRSLGLGGGDDAAARLSPRRASR